LIDSGSTDSLIDPSYVDKLKLSTTPLWHARVAYNVDGSVSGRRVTHVTELIMRLGNHVECITFYVTQIGYCEVIVGHTWLAQHNPDIHWPTGRITMTCCPAGCDTPQERIHTRQVHIRGAKYNAAGRAALQFVKPQSIWVRATETVSSHLAAANTPKDAPEQTVQEIVPAAYHHYVDVFAKASFDQLPESRPWDHAIELQPDSMPHNCKVYPMSLSEQVQLDEFLRDNLATGRIRPSKLPMASPVFFVKKKDGSLRL
ncbi:hypothetical protein CALVIDRAFT_466998, partial [Calocera viscosa TUFC12733]